MAQEGYLARLGIDTSDVDTAVNATIDILVELRGALPQLSKEIDAAERSMAKAGSSGREMAGGLERAAVAASAGARGWAKYKKALDDANAAQREFARGQITGAGGGTDARAIGRDKQDSLLAVDAAERGSAISAIKEVRAEEARAAAERTAALDRDLADSARLESAQLGRVAAVRAAEQIAAAARARDAAAAVAAANAARASAFQAGGIDSRLGRDSANISARGTSMAQAGLARNALADANQAVQLAKIRGEEGQLAAARERLRRSTEAATSAAIAYNNAARSSGPLSSQAADAANTLADARQNQARASVAVVQAEEQQIAALSRTRYALYDVSQIATITGVALAATATVFAGAAVAFERDFADVRRTVGVTGDAADGLYDRFIRLSTQIPVSFGELSEIGTLAGQLGVAEGRVASFTETTAQFAATTDVTVGAAATAFGRLDSLLGDVQGNYSGLASSILNVGVNTVATESSIISTTSQIAAAGSQAGLTADEVVGLAGALASLGIAPEAARGSVLRTFSVINAAVANGGAELERFGQISGMSAEEFQNGWSTDFTSTFLSFLGGLQAQGRGAETTIRDLGITATRDVNALLRLSQNADVTATSLGLAADGFADASILSANFGVIAETNAAKLQVLWQTVQALAAVVGSATSGPLSDMLDFLQRFANSLIILNQNDVVAGANAIVIGFTAVGGVLALLIALATRGVASWYALRTAIGATTLQSLAAQGGMRGLAATLLGVNGAAVAARAGLMALGSATVIGVALTGALFVITEAVNALAAEMQTAEQRASSYFGTLDGLGAAVAADNPALMQQADATEAMAENSAEADATLGELVATLVEQQAATQATAEATNAAGEALANHSLRIGENTQEWLRNQLVQSEAFQEMIANAQALNSITGQGSSDYAARPGGPNSGAPTFTYENLDLQALTDAATEAGGLSATAYYEQWMAGLQQAFTQSGGIGNILNSGTLDDATEQAIRDAEAYAEALDAAVTEGMNQAAVEDFANALAGTGAEAAFAADGLDELSNSGFGTSDAFRAIMDSAYGAVNAERAIIDGMYGVGAAFAENGAQVAFSGAEMQSAIERIVASSGSAPAAAANLQGFFNMLVEGGYASAQQLAGLQAVIAGLTGGAAIPAVSVPKFNPAAFVAGMNSVKKAAGGGGRGGKGGGGGGGAAAAVRTLTDYASDLRKVFSRSFDIRFGGMQAMDDITSKWQDIRDSSTAAQKDMVEAMADLNEAMKEYQQTVQELSADKAIKTYWLSVAESYGDTLRAGELRAELTDIDNDLAKSAADLAKAQADAAAKQTAAQESTNRSLVGNSAAAISNRSKILDLVGGYQDYIAELAESGVSQEELQRISAELKQRFIDEATQLGFNQQELGLYARAFDDVTLAIGRVPRNITVAANTNPAIQALRELEAQATRSGAAAGQNFAGGFGSGYGGGPAITYPIGDPAAAGATAGAAFKRAFAARSRGVIILADPATGERVPFGSVGVFRRGGWTGNGSPSDVAGLVHGREFVLNETGAQMLPREMLEAANQGRAPQMPTIAVPGLGGGMGETERMAWSAALGLLERIANNGGDTITGDALGRMVSAANVSSSRMGRG